MKQTIFIIITAIMFFGCTKEPIVKQEKKVLNIDESGIRDVNNAMILFKDLPNTYLKESDFKDLPDWDSENYNLVLKSFKNSCTTKKTKKIYKQLCKKAKYVKDAKSFLQQNLTPFEINKKNGENQGLLTGYYEPLVHVSLKKKGKYKYPLYKRPKDLIIVDLGSIYPKLKHYRLRGRLDGNKLVPYYTRKEINSKQIDADALCYCDSRIDRFFLEVQGSGRAKLDNGKTMFIGYADQNGHRYKSIGRYLVKHKIMKLKDVSLQSIRKWLDENPDKIDKILNYNKSFVYFRRKNAPASGSLGIKLTPKRSVAVDRRYIPLGSMLYLSANDDKIDFNKVVLAQDTGGAIKGALRADMFLGYGKDAREIAGKLKAPLKLWILLPKSKKELKSEAL